MKRVLLPGVAALVGLSFAIVPGPAGAALPTGREGELISITARAETPPVFDDEAGGDGDADDPAIWVNRRNRSASVVIGAAKNAGLLVYDLQARILQSIPAPAAPTTEDEAGRFNNVDIVSGFRLGGRQVDLAVTSDRGRDQLRSYAIDSRTGLLSDVTADDVPYAFAADQAEVNEQQTAYGLTTFRGRGGAAYVVVTRRHTTEIALLRLVAEGARVSYRKIDTLRFPDRFRLPDGQTWAPCVDPGEGPQLEGLVVDEATGTLYAAQEDVGLWRVQLGRGRFASGPRIVERTREFGIPAAYDPVSEECRTTGADPGFGGRIVADVEGLTIYPTGRRSGTLLVSSQGDNTFYTYDRQTLRPRRHFAVVAGRRTDGSQDCDGADTVSTPLPGYPNGLLVVQDGSNTPDVIGEDGEVRTNTNFKFLDAGILRRR